MKILSYGEIMDKGRSAFLVVAQLDGTDLLASFKGAIRVDDPYQYLADFICDLALKLPGQPIEKVTFDFTELEYCNSNGFYSLMEIIETIYQGSEGAVYVKRLKDDDWQQQTLPILLNLRNADVKARTELEDFCRV